MLVYIYIYIMNTITFYKYIYKYHKMDRTIFLKHIHLITKNDLNMNVTMHIVLLDRENMIMAFYSPTTSDINILAWCNIIISY